VGYHYKNASRIPRGTYNYSYYHYYPRRFSTAKVDEILKIIERPLQVKAEKISPQE
jgi:hypothetical protein